MGQVYELLRRRIYLFKRRIIKATTIAIALGGIVAFTSTPSHAILGDQVLKSGMVHEDVQVLQQELKDLGFFKNNNVTSYYGTVTEEALKEFQNSENIVPSGIFDKVTYEALQTSKPVELSAETDSNKKVLTFDRELSLEMKGEDVKLFQEALKALGFLKIENSTDYFGTMTKDSLIVFQEANNLKPDGILDLRTVDAINKVLLGRGINLPSASRGSEIGTLSTKLAATAKQYLGHRYISGGASPSGFDCSGFTSYVYKQHGITLPRASTSQAYVGNKLNKADLLPGDLLIFSNTYKAGPSHTGIYLGNGQFIHASTSTTGVIISDLNSTYYTSKFTYGRRLY